MEKVVVKEVPVVKVKEVEKIVYRDRESKVDTSVYEKRISAL